MTTSWPQAATETRSSAPFTIAVPDAELDDLRDRLSRTRWPNVPAGAAEMGLPIAFVRRTVDYWLSGYDWRAHEADLNTLHHEIRTANGLDLHVIHEHAAGDGVPLLLLHGWPDTFYGFRRLLPRLVAAGHDVVVPSIPGYGFSAQPTSTMIAEEVAETAHQLMLDLGYQRYAVHGGDWGGALAEQIALTHSEAVVALHLLDVPYQHQFVIDRRDVSDAERAFLQAGDAWAEKAAYFSIQSTQPLTLAYGLADSPVGLLAWIGEKYAAWSDREPDLDDVITQAMIFWHSNTIWSSFRLYAEGLGSWDDSADWSAEETGPDDGAWSAPTVTVPTGFALFPGDIGVPPREYAERFFAVRRFTHMERGGHFGAREEPEALAAEIVAFLADVDHESREV